MTTRSDRRIRRASVWLLLLLSLLAPNRVGAQILHLVPSTHIDRAPQSFLDACMNVSRWPGVFARTTYLGAVSWQLRADRAGDAALARCFAEMVARELQLSLEVSIMSNAEATGLQGYLNNLPDWQRYQNLGAPLAALFIDEPITNGSRIWGLPYGTIVSETVNWIALVRQNPRFASVKLILIEAYPHLSAATIINFINDVNNGAALRSVAGLDALQIDHAWDGAQGRWSGSDLADMRAAAHRRRMDFSMIFYAAMPFRNPVNDCDFRTRLYQQWESYEANGMEHYGFYPDIYTIQSWDELPSVTVPESTAACTFMQAARQWLDSIDRVPTVRSRFWPTSCRGLLGCEESPVITIAPGEP
jgi:hypothetical protein